MSFFCRVTAKSLKDREPGLHQNYRTGGVTLRIPLLLRVCLLKVFTGVKFAQRLAFLVPGLGGAGSYLPLPPALSPAPVICQGEPTACVWPDWLESVQTKPSHCWVIQRSQRGGIPVGGQASWGRGMRSGDRST